MPTVEVLDERYQDQNPLTFKSHPKGQKLHWANHRWRGERKGWGQLRPVKKTDPDFQEIVSHLHEAPLDIDIHGDNLVHRGDLILCVVSEEQVEKRRQRNYNRATRLTKDLKAGRNLVAEELERIHGKDDLMEPTKSTFEHSKGKK